MTMADDFDWNALDFDIEEPDVVDVKKLNDLELLNLERDLVAKLKDLGEMISKDTTDEGREIHSLRAAARIELITRGLIPG